MPYTQDSCFRFRLGSIHKHIFLCDMLLPTTVPLRWWQWWCHQRILDMAHRAEAVKITIDINSLCTIQTQNERYRRAAYTHTRQCICAFVPPPVSFRAHNVRLMSCVRARPSASEIVLLWSSGQTRTCVEASYTDWCVLICDNVIE